jgi:hypothetical protein
MKRTILLLVMMQIMFSLNAQINHTNFGVSSGPLGDDASYFGYNSGNTATGQSNSFFGAWSGRVSTGPHNAAIGFSALFSNTSGQNNTAGGAQAMRLNTTGNQNTAFGWSSLQNNTSNHNNSAFGFNALGVSTGSSNSAFGHRALVANTTGSSNCAFGAMAGPTSGGLSNTIAIGNSAVPTASNQARIGNTSVTSIGGQVSWTTFSDGRFKRDLKEDVSGLDFINELRPVSYIVDKNAIDKFLGIPDSVIQLELGTKSVPVRQTGFVAQEVEAIIKKSGYVFSGVEVPQNERDHYSIRYGEFVVPLVKAMQELTTIVKEQEKKFEEQQIEITELKKKLGVYEGSINETNSNIKTALFQNNPNPFSVDTEIKMTLPETASKVNLIVYNLEGKQLSDILVSERGDAKAIISASELSAGMYLYALIVDGKIVDTKRLILTK